MAVFTYIATAIVTAVTGAAVVAGTWAAFAVSVIATGLAAVTSRFLGLGGRGGAGSQDQGVRVQLPPNTETKIPIIYGTAYQQGIITDARISDSNQKMTYVLVLSEKTQTGVWSVGDIYWNDQRLVFKAGDSPIVDYGVGQDGSNNTNLDGLVTVNLWAGGSSSTYQIFPANSATNAYDIIPDVDSSYQLNDLVFATVQLTYDGDKGVTSLPTMTFQLTNSLKNPGLVWYDYMTSTRYGAGFTATEINTVTSISTTTGTSLYSISNQIPDNQFTRWPDFTASSTGTTATNQVRYEINGVLNTGDTVKTNIEKINLASASYTTFDHKTGQWSVVPNRALTTSELALCYSFTDLNIIGDVSLSATNLEDLYNQLEVGFPNRVNRDQTDYYKDSLPSNELNQLETPNQLRMSTALCNNYIHAARVGLIELKQSRADLVISFQSDYGALQVEAGDVVKVTNSTYGFEEKPFRVTRVRETEGEDASLVSEITALEYTATVYVDSTLTDLSLQLTSGIPSIGGSSSIPAPSTPVIDSVSFYTFIVATDIDSTSIPVDHVEWQYSTTSTGGTYYLLTNVSGNFVAGQTVYGYVSSLGPGVYYIRARTSVNGVFSDPSANLEYLWEPTYDFGG